MEIEYRNKEGQSTVYKSVTNYAFNTLVAMFAKETGKTEVKSQDLIAWAIEKGYYQKVS